jgi:hypothetical protein
MTPIRSAYVAAATLFILAVAGGPREARSQWVSSDSSPVRRESTALQWVDWDKDPERSYLWRGNTLVGGYCHAEQIYRNYDSRTGSWSEPAESPVTPPPRGGQNFGLMHDKLDGPERASINGQAVTPRTAIEAIENSIPEVAKKPRVVIIDRDAERRKQVREELTRLPECGDCVVQAYPPDHWHLLDLKTRQPGFFVGGSPTIYLLAPDGNVLHRQDEYEGGVAAAAEAFRRARADYDPRRDPDRRKPSPEPLPLPRPQPQPSPLPPAPAPWTAPSWIWLLVLGAAALYLFQRRQQQ